MNDQIKLAEAMGWELEEVDHQFRYCYKRPDGYRDAFLNQEALVRHLPDPLTDANDDYAVLEWMRENSEANWKYYSNFKDELHQKDSDCLTHFVWNYQIGDYARAALKVLA